MNSLPEQFSAARQTQIDNSFKLMRSFSDGVLDRASRVLALQLDASRATVEQSSSAMRQLLALHDPRDLLALGSQSQQHLRTLFDYSRELFSIAAGINASPLRSYSVDTPALNAPAALETAPQPEAATDAADTAEAAEQAFERVGGDTASAVAAAAESAAELVAAEPAAFATTEQAEPAAAAAVEFALPADSAAEAVEVVTSDVEPDAAPTPIAKATSEALDLPVAPPHPVAVSLPVVEVAVEIELPKVEPVDAVPPPAVAPATTRPVETRGTKGRKKQNG